MNTFVPSFFRSHAADDAVATVSEDSSSRSSAQQPERAYSNFDKAFAAASYDLDGNILSANERFCGLVGYSEVEMRGRNRQMLMSDRVAESGEYRDSWSRVARGEQVTGNFAVTDRHGNEMWLKSTLVPVATATGQIDRIEEFAVDITDFVQQESEMGRLTSMLESMPIAVMYVDRDLIVRYANPASIAILRQVEHAIPIKAEQLVGTCIDVFHKSPEYQRKLLGDPSNLPITTQIKLGGEILSFSVSAIYDKGGNYIGAMASGRVMTEEAETKAKAKDVGLTMATSVTEMGVSIDEISRSVSRTANLAKDVTSMASQTESYAGELSQASQEIGDVVSVIQEFADQTNLLALNATIEAARAGESGRSFAVVAGEVKELATETAKAADSIDRSVRAIQSSISQVVDSTKQITQGIGEVSDNTSTVASAIEEQSVTMTGLGARANELKEITDDAS